MKTCMLGRTQKAALVVRWPEVVAKGVLDEDGKALFPGDLVSLPAGVRWGTGADWPVPGTVTGYAVDKRGVPSVVVHAPAWNGGRAESWRTWIVDGELCRRVDEAEANKLSAAMVTRHHARPDDASPIDGGTRENIGQAWLPVMLAGVTTKGRVTIRPGDLVRLPRNVARNRGSQLHAAGLCMGYAVGLDGSPCVVVDAVGEDVPELVRWRTWVVRGNECLVIDSKEAWRLESLYDRSGRLKPRKPRRK